MSADANVNLPEIMCSTYHTLYIYHYHILFDINGSRKRWSHDDGRGASDTCFIISRRTTTMGDACAGETRGLTHYVSYLFILREILMSSRAKLFASDSNWKVFLFSFFSFRQQKWMRKKKLTKVKSLNLRHNDVCPSTRRLFNLSC